VAVVPAGVAREPPLPLVLIAVPLPNYPNWNGDWREGGLSNRKELPFDRLGANGNMAWVEQEGP